MSGRLLLLLLILLSGVTSLAQTQDDIVPDTTVFTIDQSDDQTRQIFEVEVDLPNDIDRVGAIFGVLFDPEPSNTSASMWAWGEERELSRLGGTPYPECHYTSVTDSERIFFSRPEGLSGDPIEGNTTGFISIFDQGLERDLNVLEPGIASIFEITNQTETVALNIPDDDEMFYSVIISVIEDDARWAWNRGIFVGLNGGPIQDETSLGVGAEQVSTPSCGVFEVLEDTTLELSHRTNSTAEVLVMVVEWQPDPSD